jgi:hypothetical protein
MMASLQEFVHEEACAEVKSMIRLAAIENRPQMQMHHSSLMHHAPSIQHAPSMQHAPHWSRWFAMVCKMPTICAVSAVTFPALLKSQCTESSHAELFCTSLKYLALPQALQRR